jgi:hypothetical protein
MPRIFVRSAVAGAVLTVGLTACGSEECVIPPCLEPLAVTVTLQSSVAGRTLDGAFVRINGNDTDCAGTETVVCHIRGSAGTYELDIGATGFQSVHRSVNVQAASTAKCGCPGAETQELSISLTPVA